MAPIPETFVLHFVASIMMFVHETGTIGSLGVERTFVLDPTKILTDKDYVEEKVEEMVDEMDIPYSPRIDNKVIELARHVYERRPTRSNAANQPIVSLGVVVFHGVLEAVNGEFDSQAPIQHEVVVPPPEELQHADDDEDEEDQNEKDEDDVEKKEEHPKDDTPK